MTQITISLSEGLAEKAQQAGLLAPEQLERMLESELKRQQVFDGFDLSERIQAAVAAEGIEPMTMDEIQAEVDAVRAEQRARSLAQ